MIKPNIAANKPPTIRARPNLIKSLGITVSKIFVKNS